MTTLHGDHVSLHGDRVSLRGDRVSLRGVHMQFRVLLQTVCHTVVRLSHRVVSMIIHSVHDNPQSLGCTADSCDCDNQALYIVEKYLGLSLRGIKSTETVQGQILGECSALWAERERVVWSIYVVQAAPYSFQIKPFLPKCSLL